MAKNYPGFTTAPRRLQALGSTRRASDTEIWLASTNEQKLRQESDTDFNTVTGWWLTYPSEKY